MAARRYGSHGRCWATGRLFPEEVVRVQRLLLLPSSAARAVRPITYVLIALLPWVLAPQATAVVANVGKDPPASEVTCDGTLDLVQVPREPTRHTLGVRLRCSQWSPRASTHWLLLQPGGMDPSKNWKIPFQPPCGTTFDWPLTLANRAAPTASARMDVYRGTKSACHHDVPMPFFIRRSDYLTRDAMTAPVSVSAIQPFGHYWAIGGRGGVTILNDPFEQAGSRLSYLDGLPDDTVISLDGREGVLWILTARGVCRYDGPGTLLCTRPATRPSLQQVEERRVRQRSYRVIADPIYPARCAWEVLPDGRVLAVQEVDQKLGTVLRETAARGLDSVSADDIAILDLGTFQQLWVLESLDMRYTVFERSLPEWDAPDAGPPCDRWSHPLQVPTGLELSSTVADPFQPGWVWGRGGTALIACRRAAATGGLPGAPEPETDQQACRRLDLEQITNLSTIHAILPLRDGVWVGHDRGLSWLPRKKAGKDDPPILDKKKTVTVGAATLQPVSGGTHLHINAIRALDGDVGDPVLVVTDAGRYECTHNLSEKRDPGVTCKRRVPPGEGSLGPRDAHITAASPDRAGRFWVGDSSGGVHALVQGHTLAPFWACSTYPARGVLKTTSEETKSGTGASTRACRTLMSPQSVRALAMVGKWLYIAYADRLYRWNVGASRVALGEGPRCPSDSPEPVLFQKPGQKRRSGLIVDVAAQREIAKMLVDENGVLWVATSRGIYTGPPDWTRYRTQRAAYLQTVDMPRVRKTDARRANAKVKSIAVEVQDQQSARLWVVRDGLSCFDVTYQNTAGASTAAGDARKSPAVTVHLRPCSTGEGPAADGQRNDIDIEHIFLDHTNRLWAWGQGDKLFRGRIGDTGSHSFQPVEAWTKRLRAAPPLLPAGNDNVSSSNAVETNICALGQDSRGNIWALVSKRRKGGATGGGGDQDLRLTYAITPQDGVVGPFGPQHGLSPEAVFIARDTQGALWFGDSSTRITPANRCGPERTAMGWCGAFGVELASVIVWVCLLVWSWRKLGAGKEASLWDMVFAWELSTWVLAGGLATMVSYLRFDPSFPILGLLDQIDSRLVLVGGHALGLVSLMVRLAGNRRHLESRDWGVAVLFLLLTLLSTGAWFLVAGGVRGQITENGFLGNHLFVDCLAQPGPVFLGSALPRLAIVHALLPFLLVAIVRYLHPLGPKTQGTRTGSRGE